MTDYKRAVAKKVRISDVLAGKYVKDDGELPSHVVLETGEIISRVNIIATIISKGDDGSAILDDGSGRIAARVFSGTINQGIGDLVMVIGRLREFGDMYISTEIIKKVASEWAALRKDELAKGAEVKTPSKDVRKSDFVLNVIKNLDKGDGAAYEDIINSGSSNDTKSSLSYLLEQGLVFEIRPGKFKTLD